MSHRLLFYSSFLLYPAFVVLIGACAFFPSQRALKKCRFEALSYSVTGLDKQGLIGQVDLKAVNPGSGPAKIHRLDLVLIHDADTLAKVQNQTLVHLPAKDSLVLPMRILVPFTSLAAMALPIAMGSKLDCQILGDAYVDTPLGTYTLNHAIRKKMVLDLSLVRDGWKAMRL